jgi:hypothetical protein
VLDESRRSRHPKAGGHVAALKSEQTGSKGDGGRLCECGAHEMPYLYSGGWLMKITCGDPKVARRDLKEIYVELRNLELAIPRCKACSATDVVLINGIRALVGSVPCVCLRARPLLGRSLADVVAEVNHRILSNNLRILTLQEMETLMEKLSLDEVTSEA